MDQHEPYTDALPGLEGPLAAAAKILDLAVRAAGMHGPGARDERDHLRAQAHSAVEDLWYLL